MDQNSSPTSAGQSPDSTDMSQPVAYDQQGRPLYAHPPQPPTVHISRPVDVGDTEIPPEIMQRYEESRKKFPHLNISPGEYVISAVRRHPIGLVKIWFVAVSLIAALAAVLLMLVIGQENAAGNAAFLAASGLAVVSVLVVCGALVASYIYNSNRFYLTNESVIQEIQHGLFAKHEQTVSLSNIEDASYKQTGLLSVIFNYGTIRLSTEGDETTYSFTYVANPKPHIATLNNAVEAFKMGRRVDQPS